METNVTSGEPQAACLRVTVDIAMSPIIRESTFPKSMRSTETSSRTAPIRDIILLRYFIHRAIDVDLEIMKLLKLNTKIFYFAVLFSAETPVV